MGKCPQCRRLQRGGKQSTGSRLQYCSITQSETVGCSSTADTSPALLLTLSATISVFMLLASVHLLSAAIANLELETKVREDFTQKAFSWLKAESAYWRFHI